MCSARIVINMENRGTAGSEDLIYVCHANFPYQILRIPQCHSVSGYLQTSLKCTSFEADIKSIDIRIGWVIITYTNKKVLPWLEKTLSWRYRCQGDRVKIVPRYQFPTFYCFKCNIPNILMESDNAIITYMNAENPFLDCQSWRVVCKSYYSTYCTIVISIQGFCLQKLLRANFSLQYKGLTFYVIASKYIVPRQMPVNNANVRKTLGDSEKANKEKLVNEQSKPPLNKQAKVIESVGYAIAGTSRTSVTEMSVYSKQTFVNCSKLANKEQVSSKEAVEQCSNVSSETTNVASEKTQSLKLSSETTKSGKNEVDAICKGQGDKPFEVDKLMKNSVKSVANENTQKNEVTIKPNLTNQHPMPYDKNKSITNDCPKEMTSSLKAEREKSKNNLELPAKPLELFHNKKMDNFADKNIQKSNNNFSDILESYIRHLRNYVKPEDARKRATLAANNYKELKLVITKAKNFKGLNFYNIGLIQNVFESIKLIDELSNQHVQFSTIKYAIVCKSAYPNKFITENFQNFKNNFTQFLESLPIKPALGFLTTKLGGIQIQYGNEASLGFLKKIITTASNELKVLAERELPSFWGFGLTLPFVLHECPNNTLIRLRKDNGSMIADTESWKIAGQTFTDFTTELFIVMSHASFLSSEKRSFAIRFKYGTSIAKPFTLNAKRFTDNALSTASAEKNDSRNQNLTKSKDGLETTAIVQEACINNTELAMSEIVNKVKDSPKPKNSVPAEMLMRSKGEDEVIIQENNNNGSQSANDDSLQAQTGHLLKECLEDVTGKFIKNQLDSKLSDGDNNMKIATEITLQSGEEEKEVIFRQPKKTNFDEIESKIAEQVVQTKARENITTISQKIPEELCKNEDQREDKSPEEVNFLHEHKKTCLAVTEIESQNVSSEVVRAKEINGSILQEMSQVSESHLKPNECCNMQNSPKILVNIKEENLSNNESIPITFNAKRLTDTNKASNGASSNADKNLTKSKDGLETTPMGVVLEGTSLAIISDESKQRKVIYGFTNFNEANVISVQENINSTSPNRINEEETQIMSLSTKTIVNTKGSNDIITQKNAQIADSNLESVTDTSHQESADVSEKNTVALSSGTKQNNCYEFKSCTNMSANFGSVNVANFSVYQSFGSETVQNPNSMILNPSYTANDYLLSHPPQLFASENVCHTIYSQAQYSNQMQIGPPILQGPQYPAIASQARVDTSQSALDYSIQKFYERLLSKPVMSSNNKRRRSSSPEESKYKRKRSLSSGSRKFRRSVSRGRSPSRSCRKSEPRRNSRSPARKYEKENKVWRTRSVDRNRRDESIERRNNRRETSNEEISARKFIKGRCERDDRSIKQSCDKMLDRRINDKSLANRSKTKDRKKIAESANLNYKRNQESKLKPGKNYNTTNRKGGIVKSKLVIEDKAKNSSIVSFENGEKNPSPSYSQDIDNRKADEKSANPPFPSETCRPKSVESGEELKNSDVNRTSVFDRIGWPNRIVDPALQHVINLNKSVTSPFPENAINVSYSHNNQLCLKGNNNYIGSCNKELCHKRNQSNSNTISTGNDEVLLSRTDCRRSRDEGENPSPTNRKRSRSWDDDLKSLTELMGKRNKRQSKNSDNVSVSKQEEESEKKLTENEKRCCSEENIPENLSLNHLVKQPSQSIENICDKPTSVGTDQKSAMECSSQMILSKEPKNNCEGDQKKFARDERKLRAKELKALAAMLKNKQTIKCSSNEPKSDCSNSSELNQTMPEICSNLGDKSLDLNDGTDKTLNKKGETGEILKQNEVVNSLDQQKIKEKEHFYGEFSQFLDELKNLCDFFRNEIAHKQAEPKNRSEE